MAQWYGNIGKITLPTPFAVGDVNVYIVKGDALTLVDAAIKTDDTWEFFVHELKQLGYEPKDIEQAIITHHHPDHVGLLDYLDVPIIGHKYNKRWLIRDEEFMNEYRQFYSQLFDEAAVPKHLKTNIRKMEATLQFSSQRSLNITIEEGMEIRGLSGWFVIETPGHAQSHISLIHQKSGIVIGGDHILATISSNPLLEPPFEKTDERPKPQLQYNESLKKMKDYYVELIFTGHGNEVRHAHELIDRRLSRQHERAMKVKAMINGHPLTAFDICKQLFPHAYERELSLTMSETIGQIDYLQSLDEIAEIEDVDGKKCYISK